jgi:hypothetical protein
MSFSDHKVHVKSIVIIEWKFDSPEDVQSVIDGLQRIKDNAKFPIVWGHQTEGTLK